MSIKIIRLTDRMLNDVIRWCIIKNDGRLRRRLRVFSVQFSELGLMKRG